MLSTSEGGKGMSADLTQDGAEHKYHLVWDWNGTVLNDVELCFTIMNIILKEYNKKSIDFIEKYKERFCFPIQEFYEKLGFDTAHPEFYSALKRYHKLYRQGEKTLSLNDGVSPTIQALRNKGVGHSLLSASPQDVLDRQVSQLKVRRLFDYVIGISSHYIPNKLCMAQKHVKLLRRQGKEPVFVGDTIYDQQVATKLGCKCILVTIGHQALHIHSDQNTQIINSFFEISDVLFNRCSE